MAEYSQTVAPENNDGSVTHAALNMPDFDDGGIDDPSPAKTVTEFLDPREAANRRNQPDQRQPQLQQKRDNGKYAEGFEERRNLPAEADQIDDKPEPEVLQAQGEPSEHVPLDEQFFEIPTADPKKPARYKATDVFRGFQETQMLREALEQMARITPPPPQYDEEIYKTVQVRGRLMQEVDQFITLNQPIEPDMSLIDGTSPRYNPEEYHRQAALQKSQIARLHQMHAYREHQQQQHAQEQEALTAARKAREQSKLVQFWPELKDPTVQRQVKDDAARFFGIDDQIFSTVQDARFYAVLRSALENVHSQRRRQDTVRMVTAKPKLVKGAARDPVAPKQAQFNSSMKRLQVDNSIESAAEAMGALI